MTIDPVAIERLLWPRGSNRDIWMIVDGARDRKIYWEITNSHLECTCLYSGDIPFELEAVAPHLVQLEFEDKSTRELIARAWGRSWGVFLSCEAPMKRLRRHLRTFLVVHDWGGRRLLFRYYDPRVLRVYIPTCTSDELKTVFGPIKQFWAESETSDRLVNFDFTGGKLRKLETAITP